MENYLFYNEKLPFSEMQEDQMKISTLFRYPYRQHLFV